MASRSDRPVNPWAHFPRLGHRQERMLRLLVWKGCWWPDCGWPYRSAHRVPREILLSLEKWGMVTVERGGRCSPFIEPTEASRMWANSTAARPIGLPASGSEEAA